MALISCKDVKLAYEGNTVVSDLNFEVNGGDYLCIVGENGSGKTTLMKALIGLKDVSAGSIEFSDDLKRNEIGYLPQQNSIQKDFPACVLEVVLSGTLSRGRSVFYSKSDREKATNAMKTVGIEDLKNKSFRELSGGQQQRVLLARAVCATSKLIILDEPVSGLDPLATRDLYCLISDVNRRGITVIMVTHDVDSAIKYATHILHVGKTPKFFGKASDYVNAMRNL